MAVGAFDRTVLMRHTLVVAGRLHPVMGAQRLVACRQVRPRVAVEIAESRRQAVAAMIMRRSPHRPQRILKPFRQGDEALPAEDDMGMLEPRPRQAEVVEQMIQRLPRNGHADRPHVRKIRQAEAAGFVNLPEDHLLIFAMFGPPGTDPALQRPANARGQFRVTAQHLLIDSHRTDARRGLQQGNNLSVEDALQRVWPPPFPRPRLLRRQLRILHDTIARRTAHPGLGRGRLDGVVLSQLHEKSHLMIGYMAPRHKGGSPFLETTSVAGRPRSQIP